MSIARFGQNMFDIVIREAGRLEAIFELALYNQLTVDDSLDSGTVLTTTYTNTNDTVKDFFANNGILPNNWDEIIKVWAEADGTIWETPDGDAWEWL